MKQKEPGNAILPKIPLSMLLKQHMVVLLTVGYGILFIVSHQLVLEAKTDGSSGFSANHIEKGNFTRPRSRA